MLGVSRCSACGERFTDGETAYCEDCGGRFHEPCEEYARTYQCRECADEQWIGALEF